MRSPLTKLILARISEETEKARADYEAATSFIRASDLNFRGRCVRTLPVPKIFTSRDVEIFSGFASALMGILDKITNAYINDPAYRAIFGYDPALDGLIRLTPQYSVSIPMARIDIFYNEDNGDIKLCEINTDGTSAMNENRVLGGALALNGAFRELGAQDLYSHELFGSWVEAFLELWKESGRPGLPRVAILDFLDKATLPEFGRFRDAFAKAGAECVICDIRQVKFESGRLLTPEGGVIDAVYRRATTGDIMNAYEGLGPFLDAVRSGAVLLAGAFRTQIAHNKRTFVIFRHPATKSLLSAAENDFIERHIPETYDLTERIIGEIGAAAGKDGWIIKPEDSYGSKGVYAGADADAQEWEHLLRENVGAKYLIQRFVRPYLTQNVDFSGGKAEFRQFSNLTGLFCYNGALAGIYSRASKGAVISSQYDEFTLATLCHKM